MAGPDIKIDLEALTALASNLSSILEEFTNANSNADSVATATGEDGLKDRVETFARNWDIRRKDMLEDIEVLQSTVQGIADNFTAVDGDLAAALEESEDGGPGGTGSGSGAGSGGDGGSGSGAGSAGSGGSAGGSGSVGPGSGGGAGLGVGGAPVFGSGPTVGTGASGIAPGPGLSVSGGLVMSGGVSMTGPAMSGTGSKASGSVGSKPAVSRTGEGGGE